jgi:hypothetical protein
LGNAGVWQRSGVRKRTILGLKFIQGTKVHGAVGARFHTCGSFTFVYQVKAHIAFGHYVLFFIELRRAIGACPRAIAAANAHVSIDQNNAIIALGDGAGRADVHADGFGAVHASRGNGIGVHITRKHLSVLVDPLAAFVLEDSTPADTNGKAALVFAGNLTGFTARAFVDIDGKSKLFSHGSSPYNFST